MPRNAFSCAAAHYAFFAAVIGVEHKAFEGIDAPLAPSDLEKGADNGSHHVSEESVRADGELPVVFHSLPVGICPPACAECGFVTLPKCFSDGADGCLAVRSDLFETAEVVPAAERFRGKVHFSEIQVGIGVHVGEGFDERVFDPMQKICIFAFVCVKSGMEIFVCLRYGVNYYRPGENGI